MNDIRIIWLTKGKFAIVDIEDYQMLSRLKWYFGSNGYAVRGDYAGGKNKKIYMHRVINKTPNGQHTDHINRNRLDNRKDNLRIATVQGNARNRESTPGSTSRYLGVCYLKKRKRWQAAGKINGASKYLGNFTDEVDAAKAYNKFIIEHYGEFANINEGV